MELRRYNISSFEQRRYSRTQILHYTEVHLGLMIAHEGVNLADRITATSTAFNLVEELTTEDLSKLAFQKSRTSIKIAFRQALPGHVVKIHSAVLAAFGAQAPEVLGCFPLGRNVFTTATDEALNNRLGQLILALTPLGAIVGPAHVTAATGLAATWDSLFGAQGLAKTAKSVTAEAQAQAMAALKVELFKNVLSIALLYPGRPEKIDLLCPQQHLKNRAAPTTPGTTMLSAGPFDAETKQTVFTMTATDAERFRLLRRMMGGPELTMIAEEIAAVDGTGTYTDTMVAPGIYDYVAEALHGTRVGARSGMVRVVQE